MGGRGWAALGRTNERDLRTIARSLCGLLTIATVGGCATTSHVTALEARIIKLERDRDARSQRYDRDQKRMTRLRSEIESSSDFLRRNGAVMTTKLDDLEDAVRRQKGADEVLTHRLADVTRAAKADHATLENVDRRVGRLIADLRDRAGITILALPRNLPEHANDWVKLAEDRFGWGEVRVAEAISKECRKRFAGTKQAGRCGLVQARIAYEEHRFGEAVVIYQAVHDGLDGKPVAEVGAALLGITASLEAEGKCKRAREILGYVVSLMKRGTAARDAKALLKSQKQRCTPGKTALPTRTSGQLKRAAEEKKAAEAAAQAKAEAEAQAAAEAKRKAEEAAIQNARATRDANESKEAEAKAEAARRAAADKAAADKATADKATADKATADKAADKAAADKAAADKAAADTAADKAAADKAAPAGSAKKPDAKKPHAKAADAKKPGAKKPGAKKPGAKKPGAKKPGAKQPGAKKPGAKQQGVKKPGAQTPTPPGKPGAGDAKAETPAESTTDNKRAPTQKSK